MHTNTPPPHVQRTIWSLEFTVRTIVFVGHTVRCAQQYFETAVTHPWAQVTKPIQTTMRWRSPISTFESGSPCCGPASCGKVKHAPRGPSCAWHGQQWWYRLYSSTSRPGASRESVMVGNRGPVVEGHHSLTTCFTNLPTITARYITTAPRLRPRCWSPIPNLVPS